MYEHTRSLNDGGMHVNNLYPQDGLQIHDFPLKNEFFWFPLPTT